MILTIFGYPKTGKTLLFNLLTDQNVEISKFSATTQEFHKAVVDVPDERLKKCADYFNTPPVYAKIEYLDTGSIAFGESKNSTFIDLVRRGDGLVHVVRGFSDDEIIHINEEINPASDIEKIEEELRTVDYIGIEKRVEKLEHDRKKIKSKEIVEELDLFQRMLTFLEEGKPLREFDFLPHEAIIVKGFKFLSQKPIIHIINCDENSLEKHSELAQTPLNSSCTVMFCGKIETELLELDEEEREIFQEEYGLKNYKYIKDSLIKTSYDLMNLQSFFTVGSDETKAWTIEKECTAYNAAGKIHSDIQQGFIRAEVILWSEFLESGGFPQAKEKGLLRLEGKEYITKDGDIMHFRFNK